MVVEEMMKNVFHTIVMYLVMLGIMLVQSLSACACEHVSPVTVTPTAASECCPPEHEPAPPAHQKCCCDAMHADLPATDQLVATTSVVHLKYLNTVFRHATPHRSWSQRPFPSFGFQERTQFLHVAHPLYIANSAFLC